MRENYPKKFTDLENLIKESGFRFKNRTLTYSNFEYKYKPYNYRIAIGENYKILDFTIQELSILRDSKIPIPDFEPFIESGNITFTIRVKAYLLKTKYRVKFVIEMFGFSGGYKDEIDIESTKLSEIKKKIDAIKEKTKGGFSQTIVDINNKRDLMENELKERYEQYKQNFIILKNYVDEYLHSTPELELCANIKIEKIDTTGNLNFGEGYRDYKPRFDEKTNILTLYEKHIRGEFHMNSLLKIHESGAIIIFQQKTEVASWRSFHDSHLYYFFPDLRRFYRANANRVKALGNINKWEVSWFKEIFADKYEDLPYHYKNCFMCGSRLHYPGIPQKIGENWVYLLRPCCNCFNEAKKSKNSKKIVKKLNKLIKE